MASDPHTNSNAYIECGYSDRKCRLEFNYIGFDIDDLESLFKVIMVFFTFTPEQVRDLFNDGLE